MEANQDHVLDLVRNQTSILDGTLNIVKRSEKDINRQFNQLHQICNKIENSFNEQEMEITETKRRQNFMELSFMSTQLLERYENLQDAFIDIITDTQHGHINPMLLPYGNITNGPLAQLKDQVTFIKANLPSELNLPGESHGENLLAIYASMKIKARMMDKLLIFDIQLPLINNNEFQMYKIHPIPVQLNGSTILMEPSTEYMLINLNRKSTDAEKDKTFYTANSIIRYIEQHQRRINVKLIC